MFSGLLVKRITIRMLTETVKSPSPLESARFHDEGDGKLLLRRANFSVLVDFAMYKSLNDRPQEFFRNDINDLRTHFIQNSLHDCFNKCRVGRSLLRGAS